MSFGWAGHVVQSVVQTVSGFLPSNAEENALEYASCLSTPQKVFSKTVFDLWVNHY